MDRVPRSGTKIVYEDRSVTFRHRHRVQRLNFSEESVTVRHTCEGSSCHSVTKFKESISVPNFQIF